MAYTKVHVLHLSMMAFLWGSMGAVYQVGDSDGWSTQADYKSWASHNKFQVGDTIVFNYNPQDNNVVEVSKKEFKKCSYSSPIATYRSGNDQIQLTTPGKRYFICSYPGHCKDGQKVQIVVKKGKGKGKGKGTPVGFDPKRTPTSASSALSFDNFLGLIALASCVLGFYLH